MRLSLVRIYLALGVASSFIPSSGYASAEGESPKDLLLEQAKSLCTAADFVENIENEGRDVPAAVGDLFKQSLQRFKSNLDKSNQSKSLRISKHVRQRSSPREIEIAMALATARAMVRERSANASPAVSAPTSPAPVAPGISEAIIAKLSVPRIGGQAGHSPSSRGNGVVAGGATSASASPVPISPAAPTSPTSAHSRSPDPASAAAIEVAAAGSPSSSTDRSKGRVVLPPIVERGH